MTDINPFNNSNELILLTSEKYLGLKEIPGKEHNPKIVEWLELVGLKGHGDETAWCAAAMNGILHECKLPTTGTALARSFEKWGQSVLGKIIPGDIVVSKRGTESWQGHVNIFIEWSKDKKMYLGRGGNQKNEYNEVWYPWDKMITVRRFIGGHHNQKSK